MLGTARNIGTHFIDADNVGDLEGKIHTWLDGNAKLTVVDIRYQMMYCKDSVLLYHVAFIIYKGVID